MSEKRTVKNLFPVLGLILLALLVVSCSNLPSKSVTVETSVPNGQNTEQDDLITRDTVENNEPVQQYVQREWAEPDIFEPTVTPIILPIEKRGEEGTLIIRDDVNEIYDTDYQSYTYSSASNDISSAASSTTAYNASPSVMRDDMEVTYYNPFNGAVVLPGQALHLDVALRNTGTTVWQTSYKVVDITASPMASQKEFNIPNPVAPGDSTLLSIYMTAPSVLGSYPENFQIQDAYGVVFGTFDYSLTVGAFTSVTEIPTQPPAPTATYYSAEGITATPDSLAWMCIDPLRSMLQDCASFCAEYSDREEFKYCYVNGERYIAPN